MATIHAGVRGGEKRVPRSVEVLRIGVGLIWLLGAIWNFLVTRRMDDPFGWLANDSRVAPWRWFFSEIIEPGRSFWIAMLVLGETILGVLTLARGGWARLGLAGGALFSLMLLSLGTTYTLMMGPYALLLGWLSRFDFPRSLIDLATRSANRITPGTKA